MSADNGIYILELPIAEGSNIKEYRVIHAQAIDNIIYMYPEGNPREIVMYFGLANLFSHEYDAMLKAQELEQECFMLEYGISKITLPHSMQYYRNHIHEVVYKWDKV